MKVSKPETLYRETETEQNRLDLCWDHGSDFHRRFCSRVSVGTPSLCERAPQSILHWRALPAPASSSRMPNKPSCTVWKTENCPDAYLETKQCCQTIKKQRWNIKKKKTTVALFTSHGQTKSKIRRVIHSYVWIHTKTSPESSGDQKRVPGWKG